MQWLLIFKLLVLLTVANGAPVIATKLFGKFLNQQLDRGAVFIDGRPILGRSKTVRGIVLSIMATTRLCANTRFRLDRRFHRSERRHDWRSIVKLSEATT